MIAVLRWRHSRLVSVMTAHPYIIAARLRVAERTRPDLSTVHVSGLGVRTMSAPRMVVHISEQVRKKVRRNGIGCRRRTDVEDGRGLIGTSRDDVECNQLGSSLTQLGRRRVGRVQAEQEEGLERMRTACRGPRVRTKEFRTVGELGGMIREM